MLLLAMLSVGLLATFTVLYYGHGCVRERRSHVLRCSRSRAPGKDTPVLHNVSQQQYSSSGLSSTFL